MTLVLVISFKKEVVSFKPDQLNPAETGKVEDFITLCLKQAGNDALLRVGLQAGYVEVPKVILEDSSVHLRPSPVHVIPYWAYGNVMSVVPMQEIKEQMDKHIEQQVRTCLFSLEAFQDTYTLTERSNPISNTEVTDTKVLFNLNWDVEIQDSAGEVVAQAVNHLTESPVKLKRVYETAKTIIEQEVSTLKFEDITQDLIALEHPDVPVSGLELSCTKKTWNVDTVEKTLLDLLRVNIRELKVKGTNYVDFPKELPYYQNHYVWNVGEDFNQKDVNVIFKFNENYPYTFAVTPLKGTRLESGQSGGNSLLSFLCLQQWKFTYDLVYPVIATVKDETTGYEFQIAFTVHLVRNEGDRSTPEARPAAILDFATTDDYCEERETPITVKTFELVENNQGVYFRNDLGGVDVSFTCLKYKCELGTTDFNFGGDGFSGMTVNFPYCTGGILRGKKEGYKENWVRVVTSLDKEAELQLTPLVKVPLSKIKLAKIPIINPFSESPSLGSPEEISSGDSALIKLSYQLKNETTIKHESTAVYSSEQTPLIKQAGQSSGIEQNLEFLAKADFTYDLDITLLNGEKIIGGYRTNWTVPWDNLQSLQEININIPTFEKGNEEEQFGFYLGLMNMSELVAKPEFK